MLRHINRINSARMKIRVSLGMGSVTDIPFLDADAQAIAADLYELVAQLAVRTLYPKCGPALWDETLPFVNQPSKIEQPEPDPRFYAEGHRVFDRGGDRNLRLAVCICETDGDARVVAEALEIMPPRRIRAAMKDRCSPWVTSNKT